MGRVPIRLRLYTRPDCSLCDAMVAALEAGFPGRVQLEMRCVDDRPEWKKRYGLRIPVLTAADDRVLCEAHFDAAAVAAHLGSLAH